MRNNSFLSKIRASFFTKVLAIHLSLFMLFDVVYPTCSWALTGGPTQPEVGGFQPVGTSDMVDLFSGDFKYNIPLMDMDGYPLNLAYSAGVSMDQEASWVGLGWSLNPGVINRSVRGIPDDFKGDKIDKEYNVKPSVNVGINAGIALELFAIDGGAFSGNLNFSLGINYSNYYGIGVEQSVGIGIKGSVGPLTGSLGINSSSENGLTITPNVSLSLQKTKKKDDDESTTVTASIGIGTSYNTRAGMKQLTVSTSVSVEQSGKYSYLNKKTGEVEQKSYKNSHDIPAPSASFDFGMPTYTPSVSMPMNNISISGNFQVGGELIGFHGAGNIGGYYNGQSLIHTSESNPSYGYMNMDEGQHDPLALFDFNRENDGEFTTATPNLPLTNFTYDLLNVSGQGVGGSYRPFRSEVGQVYDSPSYTTSEGVDIGIEIGGGNAVHGAGTFSLNISKTESGRWFDHNGAAEELQYGKNGGNKDHESWYFKEANEKSVDSDPSYYNKFGGDQAVRFKLEEKGMYNVVNSKTFVRDDGATIPVPSANYRSAREKRNQVIDKLTIKEVKEGMGVDAYPASSYAASAPDHHIGQITTYSTDGSRYVYGLPAYNTKQREVSFAAGTDIVNQNGLNGDCISGLVSYTAGADNKVDGNTRGLDNSFNATNTPAFAHSYLLTSVLSSDYVDADSEQGPSIGDLGYYTKFTYNQVHAQYNWRTPVEQGKASFNEGLKTDPTDDKASYIYGEKEIWYVDKIESKNYIAVFTIENRKDAIGVIGENGGTQSTQMSKLLRKISFYVRKEYIDNPSTAIPIKEAHFEYDYSLCPGVTNFDAAMPLSNPNETGTGKLTLKKVYFTYQKSNKARLSPYEFTYSTNNYAYSGKAYDRWGNYKPNTGGCAYNAALNNADFPYVNQNPATANNYTSAWNLSEIALPSGGTIKIDYESDDYAYVQNKKAMQMFKIVGFGDNVSSPTIYSFAQSVDVRDGFKYLFFELDPDAMAVSDIPKYFEGINEIYFKCLMQTTTGKFDYVPGYAEIDPGQYGKTGTGNYGYVRLKPVKFNDDLPTADLNPITKAAIQFARLHLQRFIYQSPAITEADSFGEQLLAELFGSDLFTNLIDNTTEFLLGPNQFLYQDPDHHVGAGLIMGKSWIRLNNPDGKKLGGGHRVKRVRMNDEWSAMVNSGAGNSFEYGQEYFYDVKGDGTGTSSGVAGYEPQIGGEENPWKRPITFTIDNCLAPDNKMYQEEPLGESFFPSPSVGYSKVTVRNLQHTNVTRHATGKVVHEFYTAKDFPTIVDRTDRDLIRHKTSPFSIESLFNIASRDFLTTSQGFVVECNDMHGKPKMEMIYQEGQTSPITSVEYKYKSTPYLSGSFRLNNTCTTVLPNGDVANNDIGVFFDMVSDMRQSRSMSAGFKLNINGEAFMIGPVPIPVVPIPIPSIFVDETQFRSATTTKIIQRFGILEETIAKDLGSTVSTKTIAYDAQTGDGLLTQTVQNFNDPVYTLSYPAHWYYDKGMGQVYKNIGISFETTSFSGGVANISNASTYFVPGDELELINGSTYTRGWVVSVSSSSITVVDKTGTNITGSHSLKVIRPGRRNMASASIASITTLSNPLANFKNNLFTNVLQASAIEFTDQWRTFCDCFTEGGEFAYTSTNPYILGTRGNWKTKKSLLHLAERTQSKKNNNSNVRKDGTFTSYTPYYKLSGNTWMKDPKDWTFTAEVTEFSPFGQELENRDALGRYSAATFGYRQTFATAVAANSRYRDLGNDNFEDYGFSPCADNHFKFNVPDPNDVTRDQAHTGRTSLRVNSKTAVIMTKFLDYCTPEGCNLTLTNNGGVYYITGGTAPYNIVYNVIYGDPTVALTPEGFQLSGSGYSIEVIITDANGCMLTQVITQ